jgi:hypothetical protein
VMSTTRTNGIQIHEDAFFSVTAGFATAGAGSVTFAEALLSVAGSVAASATGVLDVSAGTEATTGVAAPAGVDAGLR